MGIISRMKSMVTGKKEESYFVDPTGKIALLDWDSMDEETVVGVVRDRFERASKSADRLNNIEKWKNVYEHYKADYNTNEKDDKRIIKLPILFTLMENLLARVWRFVFNENIIISVEPDDRDITQEQADKVEKKIAHQMKMNNFIYKIYVWMKHTIMNGTGVMKVGYFKKSEVVTKRVISPDGNGMILAEETQVTEYPYFEIIDPKDIYVDPDAKNHQDISWVIEVCDKRLSTLLNEGDRYTNLQKLVEDVAVDGKITKKTKSAIDKIRQSGVRSMEEVYENTAMDSDTKDPIISMKVYYEKNRLVVIANDKHVIRNEENPFWKKEIPFIFSVNYLDFNTPFGIGDVEMGVKLQEYIDIMYQMVYDMIKVSMNHKLLVNEHNNIDEAKMTNKDNTIVYVEDIMGTKELVLNNGNSQYGIQIIESLKLLMEDLTSMGAYQRGAPVGQETAAGVYMIQEAGNIKFLLKIDMMEPALQELADWFRSLNYQFMPEIETVRMRKDDGSEEWIDLTPLDFYGKFKYSFVGMKNQENKDMTYAKIMQIYDRLVARPDIDQDYLLKLLVTASNVVPNPEKLINSKKDMGGDNRIDGISNAPASPFGQIDTSSAQMPQDIARQMNSLAANKMNNMNGGK